MEHRQIGSSGLKTSTVALGCGSATFAGSADETTSIEIIHRALDLGINSFDTAETYAGARSEELIGKGPKGRRDRAVVVPKFGKNRSVDLDEHPSSSRSLMRAVEDSLKRLQTDYIDLSIMHEPDQVVELAKAVGWKMPTQDVDELNKIT